MKFLLTSILFSASFAFSMGNPQNVALANTAAIGKYINDNVSNIIDSSVDLAKAQIPNSSYFLITKKVEIDAENATAILYMYSRSLDCTRTITSKVQADHYGENRVLTFSLSPSINCTPKL